MENVYAVGNKMFILERKVKAELGILQRALNWFCDNPEEAKKYNLDSSKLLNNIASWDYKQWAFFGSETFDNAGNPGYWYILPMENADPIEFGVFDFLDLYNEHDAIYSYKI